MDAGVLHSLENNNIYVMGANVPKVQIIWGFLLRGLIATGSNVSSFELLHFQYQNLCFPA